jgi:hypothetical protein
MEMKLQEDFGDNVQQRFQLNRAEIETEFSSAEDGLVQYQKDE